MTNSAVTTASKKDIADCLEKASVSITPDAAENFEDFHPYLKPGTTVFIGLLPGGDYRDVVKTASRLHAQGYRVVPHFPARNIFNQLEFEDYLACVCGAAAVDEVLVLAGDIDAPIGEFHSSMQLLETGLFDKYDIKRIGVAGHPEGTPDIDKSELRKALLQKNAFSKNTDADMYILTQFCFDAEVVIEWEKEIKACGNTLPICVGIAGPMALGSILKIAAKCKIGNSIRMASKLIPTHGRIGRKVSPEELVARFVAYQNQSPESQIFGVHIFSFGNLKGVGHLIDANT